MTRLSGREKQRAQRDAAMPETKRLVKKYGLTTVQSCLTRLRDHQRSIHELELARDKAKELEARVGRKP